MLEKAPLYSWRITPEDGHRHKKCAKYLLAAKEMREHTATEFGPWPIVEGNGGY